MKKPDGYCSICMKLLYPEEQKYRRIERPNELPCVDWRTQPKSKTVGSNELYMVCATHKKVSEDEIIRFAYAGQYYFNYDLRAI
jgi:hypothetical protein